MTQQEYDHKRYLANRDAILQRQREYDREYRRKGLRKPRKAATPRSIRDHERYMENREAILEHQRQYRESDREAYNARHREARKRRKLEKLR